MLNFHSQISTVRAGVCVCMLVVCSSLLLTAFPTKHSLTAAEEAGPRHLDEEQLRPTDTHCQNQSERVLVVVRSFSDFLGMITFPDCSVFK